MSCGGIGLVAIALFIHGFGMILTLETSRFLKARFGDSTRFSTGISILILTKWISTIDHILGFSSVDPWLLTSA